MKKSLSKTLVLKHTIALYTYLLIVWGFYRLLLFQFPEVLDILVIKPVIWLIPTFYLVKKEKLHLKSLGITTKNLLPSLYLVLILGTIFAFEGFLINYLKHGNINFAANLGQTAFSLSFLLSFATAFSEEVTFRGYLFNRVWQSLENEWLSNLITSIGWTFIHFPIALFDWKLAGPELATYLFLVFFFSVGSSFVFARTKNIFSSVLLHVLWQWPIILFR